MNIINECQRSGVPSDELREMTDLTQAGEPGVALENLCTQLLEYRCELPLATLQKITTVARSLGLAVKYWQRLNSQGAK